MKERNCDKFGGHCYLHKRFPCEADEEIHICPFQHKYQSPWELKLANAEAKKEVKP